MDTLGPGLFLLQQRSSSFKFKNVLVTPVGTKLFILIMEVFSYRVLNSEGLLREVPLHIQFYKHLLYGKRIATFIPYFQCKNI